MSQSESNSHTKKTPKTTYLLPQASSSTTTTIPRKVKLQKPSTISIDEAEKMAPFYHNPIQIGTRGTVGSLVMKEIEYFNQLELSTGGDSQKPRSHVSDHMAASSSTSHASRPPNGSVLTAQKKKKRGGSRLLPSMCSMVEISDNNNNNTRTVGVSGFGYRNLKTDAKKLQA